MATSQTDERQEEELNLPEADTNRETSAHQPSQEDAANVVSVGHQREVPQRDPSLGNTNQVDLADGDIKVIKEDPLNDNIMEKARKVLKEQFPEINGLRDARKLFLYEPPVAMQHIFSDKHWTSSFFLEENSVYLADSDVDEFFGRDYQKQLFFAHLPSFIGSGIEVVLLKVQQQTNNIDCGVYAIAFMVHFLFEYRKTGNAREAVKSLEKVRFNVCQMRPHLLNCLYKDQFEPFPPENRDIPPKFLRFDSLIESYDN